MSSTPDSRGVLAQVCRVYAGCKTFRCSAELRRRILTDSTTESRFHMQLAYAKPQQLFLQWRLDDRQNSKHHTLIAMAKAVVRYSDSDMAWQRETAIDDALASYAGISSGLALHIPSLLLGHKGVSLFERVDRESEEPGGFYRLAGTARGDIERTVLVRVADRVITQMLERYSIRGGTVECESEYRDIEIAH